jgi:Leucine-rich repeat (LRR) protein
MDSLGSDFVDNVSFLFLFIITIVYVRYRAKHIIVLDLSYNRLSEIPPEVGELQLLRYIHWTFSRSITITPLQFPGN